MNNRTTSDNTGVSRASLLRRPQPDRIRHLAQLHHARRQHQRQRRRRRGDCDLRQPLVHPVGRLHVGDCDVVLRLLQHPRQPIRRANVGSDTGDGGWKVFGYTAKFGNGLSASLSAEQQRRTRIYNVSLAAPAVGFFEAAPGLGGIVLPFVGWTNPAGSNSYEGHDYPDVVANLRVDQTWGSAQVMGALHNVAATYYGTTEASGHPGDRMGFALGGGIKLERSVDRHGGLLPGRSRLLSRCVRVTLNHSATVGDFIMYHGGTFGYGILTDAVYGAGRRPPADLRVGLKRGVHAQLERGVEVHAVGRLRGPSDTTASATRCCAAARCRGGRLQQRLEHLGRRSAQRSRQCPAPSRSVSKCCTPGWKARAPSAASSPRWVPTPRRRARWRWALPITIDDQDNWAVPLPRQPRLLSLIG